MKYKGYEIRKGFKCYDIIDLKTGYMASTTKTIQDAKEKINQWIIEDNEA
jgi:hypothetical protein